jgi:hypothetical protein
MKRHPFENGVSTYTDTFDQNQDEKETNRIPFQSQWQVDEIVLYVVSASLA